MRDRLGDLLVATAEDEMVGVRLSPPSDDAVPVTEPSVGRGRRWPAVIVAVAAALVVLAGIGVIAFDGDDQVRTVDPVDGGPVVSEPLERLPATTVVDSDGATRVAAAADATMSAPWTATVQLSNGPLDKLRYGPPNRFRLDSAEGTSSIWSGELRWDGSGEVNDAAAWILHEGDAEPSPFAVLIDALRNATVVAPVGVGPDSYRVDVNDDVCRGGGGASAPGPAGCTVIVTITDGRLARVEAVANVPLGTEVTVLDIGPADPGVRVDLPAEDPVTTTSTP